MTSASKDLPPRRELPKNAGKLAFLARFGLIFIILCLTLFIASRLAAPYFISSSLVRGSMERVIGEWSGHSIEINGKPQLSFWPRPKITLPNVVLSEDSESEKHVLVTIDALSANFSLIKALFGHLVFDDFELTRPHIFLDRNANGDLNWTAKSLFIHAINKAAQDKNADPKWAGQDVKLGAISIENGRITVRDKVLNKTYVIDSVFSDIFWPYLYAPAKGTANFLVNGVATRLDFQSRQPLLLASGNVSELNVTLAAPTVSARFSGEAGLFPGRFANGKLSVAIGDLPGLLHWTGMQLPGTEALQRISIETNASADPDRLRLDNLTLQANNAKASGVMDISTGASGKPKLAGTLAFEQMDILTFLGAFSLSAPDPQRREGKSGLLDWLEFDLSLSAQAASLGPLTVKDMGASILATDGSMIFDIADSSLASGSLSGHLEGLNGGFDQGGKLDLQLSNTEIGEIEAKLDLKGPLPVGLGSVSLSLTTNTPLWKVKPEDLQGSVEANIANGHIQSVNMDGVRALASAKPFFRLSETDVGNLAFDKLTISAQIADGAFNLHDGKLEAPTFSSQFSGIIPFDFKGLALSSETNFRPADQTSPQGGPILPPLRFFIAGSWPDLILSPVR